MDQGNVGTHTIGEGMGDGDREIEDNTKIVTWELFALPILFLIIAILAVIANQPNICVASGILGIVCTIISANKV